MTEDSCSNRVLMVWVILSLCAGAFFVVVIPSSLPPEHLYSGFLARSLILGGLIFLISFWLAKRPAPKGASVSEGRFAWVWYATPCFAVWTICLLAFWPGSMGPDSFEQWDQTLTGRFSDWHPAFHTMNIWVINHLWHSPAAVAFAQIFALGSVVGWGLAGFRRLGVPRAVLWGVSLLVAVSPVNGLLVITLWKDVAYSISILALTLLLLRIVLSNGEWLLRPKAWMMTAIVASFAALYRYNGIVTGFGTLLILLVFYPGFRRQLTFAFLLSVALFLGIRGPLYTILDVDCTKRPSLTSRLPKFFKTIRPSSPNENEEENQRQKRLITAVERDLRSGSQIWRIKPLYSYFKRIEHANIWKDETGSFQYVYTNTLGIAPSSMLPGIKDAILAFYQQSIRPPLCYFLWSPAFYLFLFLASVAITSARVESWKFLLLSTPIVLHTLQFVVMQIPGQKFIHRYHYPVILVSILLSIPLLFISKKAR